MPLSTQPPATETESRQVIQSLRISRIILPVSIGIAAVIFLFYRQFDPAQFRSIEWTSSAFAWIGLSFVLLLIRHLFYAFRLRSITGRVFSWKKCLELIVLWEFSSTITPTSKGGPAIMLFVLTKEKLPAGRTAAAVFYTMLNDVSFFVLSLPCLLLVFGPSILYPGTQSYGGAGLAGGAFFVTYAAMLVYWMLLISLLFLRPDAARRLLHWLARRSLLRRFSDRIVRMGDEFLLAASEIKTQNWRYHGRAVLGTLGAWTCKFLMINCLIMAVVPDTPLDGVTQAFIYARLVAMFIIMAFSPTPGGAGLAEIALVGFLSDFVPPGIGLVVALLWRGMAYYGYLLMGAIVTPAWFARQKTAILTPA